jgi:hypothetical protein
MFTRLTAIAVAVTLSDTAASAATTYEWLSFSSG